LKIFRIIGRSVEVDVFMIDYAFVCVVLDGRFCSTGRSGMKLLATIEELATRRKVE
jgi:hypothetical protein